jgi:hypothetical protein
MPASAPRGAAAASRRCTAAAPVRVASAARAHISCWGRAASGVPSCSQRASGRRAATQGRGQVPALASGGAAAGARLGRAEADLRVHRLDDVLPGGARAGLVEVRRERPGQLVARQAHRLAARLACRAAPARPCTRARPACEAAERPLPAASALSLPAHAAPTLLGKAGKQGSMLSDAIAFDQTLMGTKP